MSAIQLIFILVAAPVFFFMLVWVVVSVFRLLAPERTQPSVPDPVTIRQQAAAEGAFVSVGIREIREDQKQQRFELAQAPYQYMYGASDGLPSVWMEDLWRRRN